MENEIGFAENVIKIIENSRNRALKKVNEELIKMYWNVGQYLSNESANTSFGNSDIDSIAKEIQDVFPGIKGFNRRGLYRMKQFYETYVADLRKGLIQNMKEFIMEVGKDFTFIDEEYRVQVGGEDFRIDLLFFHRGLQCLVVF